MLSYKFYTFISKITPPLSVAVWFVNGYFAKLQHGVPRHQEIISYFLGTQHALFYTSCIGVLEVGMALWIILDQYRKLTISVQIGLIIIMNCLEVIFVPHLLLFGYGNLVFAAFFVSILYIYGFAKPFKTYTWKY